MSDKEVVELVEVQKIPKKSKKSKVKLSLNSFLANDDFGKASNWADDVPDLPTAPAQRTDDAPAYGQRGGSGGYRGADEREPRRSNRPELPVPDKPPFMAFVGNLNFETNETDLELLFRDMSICNIKIVRDQDEKPRGFGYVEFADKCDLVAALGYNNESVRGRRININVAEQKQREGRGYGSDSRNDTFSRADMAPLPPREGGDRRGPPPSRYGNDFSRDDMGSQLPPRDNDRRGPPQSRYNDFSRDDMAGPLPPRENDRRGPPPSRYNNDFSRDDMTGPLPPRENDRRGPPQNRYNDFSRDDMTGPLPPREQRKPVESRYKDFSRDEMTGPLPPKERSERRGPRDNSREPERSGPAPSKYGGEFSRDDITGPLPPKDKKQERKKLQLQPRTTADQQHDSKKSDAKPVHILKKDDENKGKKTVVQPEVKEGVKTGNAYDLLGEEM